MRIKVIASNPIEEQDGISELIGKEFKVLNGGNWDKETKEDMKNKQEVGIMVDKNDMLPTILNNTEYVILK